MSFIPSLRAIRRPLWQSLNRPHVRALRWPVRPARLASSSRPPREPLDAVSLHRLEAERRAYYQRRSYYAAAGAATCMLAMLVLVSFIPKELNDARSDDPLNGLEKGTPVVGGITGGSEIRKKGEAIAHGGEGGGVEQVPTGTSTIPTFPKNIALPDGAAAAVGGTIDYQLVGLGIRTVSFLGIQVYVVGLYVATEDVALLQQALIRTVDPVATTLIKTEKDKLRGLLLDPERGDQIWASVLKDTRLRSALRIVPTRNTDFQHLRDGWVRGITSRVQAASRAGNAEYEDDGFGRAMADFKGVFSGGARKSVPKAKTLVLMRGSTGALSVWYDEANGKAPARVGAVEDERISRLIWMAYLAGKNVASEGARRSVVDGVMGFVERPIGTVATQVT
ncbi:MAG: Altered inheritance of mitochondria protein 18 mitochondrial [Thelocarpon impressellum]|nr:MAG: Altered inheritance of mitochondria protein 18 mitochondrial [Thelocarpon impressellum]